MNEPHTPSGPGVRPSTDSPAGASGEPPTPAVPTPPAQTRVMTEPQPVSERRSAVEGAPTALRSDTGPARPPAGMPPEEPVTVLVKELLSEAGELFRSEAQVLRLEARDMVRATVRDLARAAAFGALALLGAICLLVFAILAVGDALGNLVNDASNGYWLSALGFGVLLVAIGGGLTYKYLKNMEKDRKLDVTKAEIDRTRQFIQAERQAFTEAVRP